jgi:molybdenum cofactor cytidylyltransferase
VSGPAGRGSRSDATPLATVGGILLAAGASTRMGARNKLLLPLDGQPMVRRAAERLLAAGVAPLVVVTGHEADAVRAALDGLPVTFAATPDPLGPTSGSLHAGLRALPDAAEAALLLLADMPHVTTAMLRAMLVRAAAVPAPLLVSRYGEVAAPPLLFRRALFAELLAWTGEGCGKAVVRRHQDEAEWLDWPVAALQDIDTPEDYAAAGGTA